MKYSLKKYFWYFIRSYFHLEGPNPNRLGLQSRQGSSNSGEGNNRESSLDDSGVVDDHEPEGDATSEEVASQLPISLRVMYYKVVIDILIKQ